MALAINPLSEAEITEIMEGTHGRGKYLRWLNDFMTSGVKAANVSETFSDTEATSISQVIRNAAKKKDLSLDTDLAVVNKDGNILIVNRVLCAAPVEEDTDPEEDT